MRDVEFLSTSKMQKNRVNVKAMRDKCLVVIAAYGKGGTLKGICAELGVEWDTIRYHIQKDSALATAYANAMKARTELMADEIVGIADDEDIPSDRARNMIQARQWVVSKLNREQFGDKVEVTHNTTPDYAGILRERRERLMQPICNPAEAIDAEVTEMPALPKPGPTDVGSVRSLTNALPGDVDPFS